MKNKILKTELNTNFTTILKKVSKFKYYKTH